MQSQYRRLQSFQTLRGFFGSRIECAEKGLYWDGSTIRCAFCSLCSSDFERFFQNPGEEHMRQNPQCPFMRNPQETPNTSLRIQRLLVWRDWRCEIVRLQSFTRIRSQPDGDVLAREGFYYELLENAIRCAFCVFREKPGRRDVIMRHDTNKRPCPLREKKQWVEFENVPLDETDALCTPKCPLMEYLDARVRSFKTAPQNVWTPLSIEKLTRCGFYYTPSSEWVTCYWCDVTLGKLQPDDCPRFKHFQKNPRCRVALNQVRPKEKETWAQKVPLPKKVKVSTFEIVRRKVEIFPSEWEDREEEKKENESVMCVVCLEKKKNVLFLNCRHLATCELCSAQISQGCPVCRKPISEKMNIFW